LPGIFTTPPSTAADGCWATTTPTPCARPITWPPTCASWARRMMPHEVAQEGALRCRRPTAAPAPDRRGRRPWSGGRREELQGDSIGVAEGDTRAVVGVLDSSVRDTKLVQARRPCLQLIAVAAGERHMIKAGAVLVEGATAGLGVGMQAKKLPAAEREHGVMKPPACSSSSRTGS